MTHENIWIQISVSTNKVLLEGNHISSLAHCLRLLSPARSELNSYNKNHVPNQSMKYLLSGLLPKTWLTLMLDICKGVLISFLKHAPLFYGKYLKSPSLPQPLIILDTLSCTFWGTTYFILL